MAGYKDLYYYVLNLSYNERKNVARKASTEIKKTLEKSIDEDKILNVLLGGICTFICSDNTVDPKEYDFFIDFTGTKIDYDSFIELVIKLFFKYNTLTPYNPSFKIDLIEIFSNIESEDWTLTIVGDGDEKENLEALIKDNNLEGKVILTGFLNKEELYKLYENSSLYVMTSFEESFGLVLVEASSFGLPLIAFDSAIGAKEIIQENGILVSNRDKSVMIKKIKKLMNDISERKLYQKKSLEIYKSYDYNTLKENIISFYQDITNNNIYSRKTKNVVMN